MNKTPVTRRAPDADPDLAQVLRRYSAKKLLAALRDHCYAEAQAARMDGFSGLGWLELHDQLEDIMPGVIDEQLVGEMIEEEPRLTRGQVFARAHKPGRW